MTNSKKTADIDAATLYFGEEFKNAHALLNAEVLLLLEAYDKNRTAASASIPYTGPNPIMAKVLSHVSATTPQFLKNNRELVRSLRHSLISTFKLSEYEMAQVGNLIPKQVEEAKILVPSLVGWEEENIQRMLDDVAVMQRFQ